VNELQVFKSAEFGTVRTIERNGEPWFVGKDVAAALGYKDPTKAARERVDEEDRGVAKIDTPSGEQEMTVINESGLYSLVLSSKLPSAKKFKRWVTSEVLPSIRKTGAYAVPKDYPSALRALADAEEQKMKLLAENQRQAQAIADFEPIRQYVDEILESPSAMATSQVAADYNLSAKALNKILFDAGIQHSVNGQWILYKRHMGKGYTRSRTIPIVRSDGSRDAKILTQWTQKGRLLIHEILTARGITAVMDRGEGQLCLE
jgi:prophage antirepressor-like protein